MIANIAAALLAIHFGPIAPDVPCRQPQMAAAPGLMAVTYGCGKSVYFAASHDGGATFSPAVQVGETGILPLGRHRGPRVAITANAIVITAVSGKTPATGTHAHGLASDGDLLVWRSTDKGKTWSAGSPINDVAGAAREGLHALAVDARGRMLAVWLDLRGNGTRLYGAHSNDAGATWSKNVLIYSSPDGTICQCCHPSAIAGDGGRMWVMWRNCVGGVRDMYISSTRDGVEFTKAEKLGTGSWNINACPMDGGGIGLNQGRVITAWRREKQIYLASPGRPEQAIGEGTDVTLAGGYVAWVSAGTIQIRSPGSSQPQAAGHGAFPNLVALPDGKALIAWENEGKIAVQRLP